MTMLSVRPLVTTFGCEVFDFDITRAEEAQYEALKELYHRSSVVVLRHQNLTPAQFEQFSAHFGSLVPQSAPAQDLPGLPGYSSICFISNKSTNGKLYERQKVGRWWHTDGTGLKTPGLTTVLYGIDTPAEGGDTLYADACEAFNTLPIDEQQRLEGVKIVHSLPYLIDRTAQHRTKALTDEERASMPDHLHPMVLTNPVTGRKAFYLTAGTAKGVVGMSDEDGRSFVKRWIEYATQPQFVYRHKWEPGDIVIWNNVTTLHSATDYDETKYDRLLYRCWMRPVDVA